MFIEYVAPEKVLESSVCFLILQKKEERFLPPEALTKFEYEEPVGDWMILKRKNIPG